MAADVLTEIAMQPATGRSTAPPPAVVVIGASAGGIGALLTLLSELPASLPAAVVIVQHRSATRSRSLLRDILARRSPLPVLNAEEGGTLRAGTVYLARPDLHLSITAPATFAYSDGRRIRHVLASANPLFESAARVFGARAIAVVLTGSGRDGTDGVQTIKEHAGIVIAQDEATSQHFGMPGSAIETGAVDFVLPLDGIAPALVRLLESRTGPGVPAQPPK